MIIFEVRVLGASLFQNDIFNFDMKILAWKNLKPESCFLRQNLCPHNVVLKRINWWSVEVLARATQLLITNYNNLQDSRESQIATLEHVCPTDTNTVL